MIKINLNITNNLNSDFFNNSIDSFLNEIKNVLSSYNSNKYTIDRFEGDFAVCENRKTKEFINIPVSKIPKDSKEGDILKFENNNYIIDKTCTLNTKNRIEQKMDKLF